MIKEIVMTILSKEQLQDRLLAIASAEKVYNDILPGLERQRDELITAIKKMQQSLADQREALKADFLAHVAEGGEVDLLPEVEFRRTSKFMYDKAEALAFVKSNNLPYTRVKVELDAVPFKRACQSGEINFPGGELVNEAVVAISSHLGHLLIPGAFEEDE